MPREEHSRSEAGKSGTLSVVALSGPLVYASKKTNRLTAAVHLVTSKVPETEPLRRIVRERSAQVLSDTIGLQLLENSHERTLHRLACAATEVGELLEVLAVAGYVSQENAQLLRDEYQQLLVFLDERRDLLQSASTISASFLEAPLETRENPSRTRLNQKDTSIKDNTSKRQSSSSAVKKTSTTTTQKKRVREEAILGLVRKQRRVTVRDVAAVVTDCSEKTLQRELLQLVEKGVLEKEGERRWSSYRLA